MPPRIDGTGMPLAPKEAPFRRYGAERREATKGEKREKRVKASSLQLKGEADGWVGAVRASLCELVTMACRLGRQAGGSCTLFWKPAASALTPQKAPPSTSPMPTLTPS